MALKSDIARDDQWFAGEDKRLAFTIWESPLKAVEQDITDWTLDFAFYVDGAVAFNVVPTIADPTVGSVTVDVPGTQTEALAPDAEMHFVLWRTNSGTKTVLSYGDVVLNQPAEV